MSLSSRQIEFTYAIGKLIQAAYNLGYQLTFGDAYRDSRVHGGFGQTKPGSYSSKNSVHKVRLAVDFNVFKNNILLEGKEALEAHHAIHNEWDKLGGSERILKDLNHYSFIYNGYR